MRLIPRTDELRMATLEDRMNRLFESFFEEPGNGGALGPPVDLCETPETVEVRAEIPGIDAKDIHISIVGDTLILRGERASEHEERGKTWHRRECSVGRFVRSIPLPARIDPEHVQAIDCSGILTVTMPKLEEEKAKRIPVQAK